MNEKYGVKKSIFLKSILIGAAAGAVISLLDKTTRSSVISSGKGCIQEMKSFVKDPSLSLTKVCDTTEQIRMTIEQITEDAVFISQKVEELKEIPPQLAHAVIETKDAITAEITNNRNEEPDDLQLHTV
ncbi:hypothetical protein [Peribacillus loiseleuriae]|uniref:YtxH domain-containing protein n=1 Tax=Peribacillus loiseleuriae TaxID=1679170 RepID=A0A0K9GPV3_9BACI|nr:hypothetical protein [Peribacillus loiseleuriae]KMY48611.1 hypothetical protein AC625_03015 [Peribacillus loiseleuriae]